MRNIPVQATPNQTFTATIEGARFEITLKASRGVMVADVSVDGVVRLRGTRVLAGEAIIPYRYLEDGNFYILTDGEQLPGWAEFGVSQQLVYLTPDEMAAARG